ncbi:MAG: hypothetical protein WBL45_04410 [Solirubrobacterales bacterium]
MTYEPRFAARFDPDAFREDTGRATPAGREVAEAARRQYEANGIPRSELRPCDPEGRDGTKLPQCLKVYLPPPVGRFGMVFKFVIANDRPRLDFLAFGVRHHPSDSNAPTVYQVANQRLQE